MWYKEMHQEGLMSSDLHRTNHSSREEICHWETQINTVSNSITQLMHPCGWITCQCWWIPLHELGPHQTGGGTSKEEEMARGCKGMQCKLTTLHPNEKDLALNVEKKATSPGNANALGSTTSTTWTREKTYCKYRMHLPQKTSSTMVLGCSTPYHLTRRMPSSRSMKEDRRILQKPN